MTDGHVRLLPIHVANKIAAGEVVERPASALKELMENSIDAGATRIDVVVTAGGTRLISVRDNGCGMDRDDALMSLERQATSKIGDVDDIERISTLGFRGEAIPSIASVSRFTLTTRRADREGAVRLVVNAGRLAEISEYGAPPGTQVEVRDLFCNVPARKKFLRSLATEESHIRSVFTAAALAHPSTGFSLNIDGRETYRLHPGDTLLDRIRSLFGPEWADGLLEVDGKQGDIHVHGFVERPRMGSSMRHDQLVFVNGRPATAAPISYALREALPRGSADARPGCVVFIELPPGEVDVNVHPAKREVRFRHSAAVRETLMTALAGASASPPAPPPPDSTIPAPPLTLAPDPYTPELDSTISRFHDSTIPRFHDSPIPRFPDSTISQSPDTRSPFPDSPVPRSPLWRTCTVLGTLSSGYLVLETDAGLVTLNPQAACERIAYEKALEGMTNAKPPCQNLLIPEVVNLPPKASGQLETYLEAFEAMGFSIENMGGDVWKVDAVPLLAADLPPAELLPSILSDIAEGGVRRGGDRWRQESLARAVARTYARFSPQTSRSLAMKLVEELSACQMPYVSPNGKPVMIFTSTRELDRRFGK